MKTTIDWLRFRTQAEVLDGLEAVRSLYGAKASSLNLQPLERGKDGFQQACSLRMGEWVLGRVDFGGDSQRGWVRWNLTGEACENVVDWDAVEECERLPGAEIRRTDIALTTWRGEVGHDTVVGAHGCGLFECGGRPPALQQITSSDPMAGRTCYVGKRDSDKFFRGYEKGLEMLAKFGRRGLPRTVDAYGALRPGLQEDRESGVVLLDGFPVEDIYRCEVELKCESRPIPWEVIERRDHYFGGCYPFLAELLPGVEADILLRRPERAPQLELAAALENCRIQYGGTLYTALHAFGGDITRVWDSVVGSQHNPALLAAGVMEVEHQ
jgi:DNA relaxase NicK